MRHYRTTLALAAVFSPVAFALLLTACGGGSGNPAALSGPPPTPTPAPPPSATPRPAPLPPEPPPGLSSDRTDPAPAPSRSGPVQRFFACPSSWQATKPTQICPGQSFTCMGTRDWQGADYLGHRRFGRCRTPRVPRTDPSIHGCHIHHHANRVSQLLKKSLLYDSRSNV